MSLFNFATLLLKLNAGFEVFISCANEKMIDRADKVGGGENGEKLRRLNCEAVRVLYCRW
jgi:hypothetical protein